MKLYRFEKLEEGRCDTLVNKQLWLARPDKFKDEFDCRIAGLSMPSMSPESYRLLNDFLRNYYHAEFNYSDSILTKDFVEKLKEYISKCYAKDRFPANSPEYFDAILGNAYLANFFKKNLFKPVGICCFFSGDSDDPEMWNNYADKQGYCIEYEYMQDERSNIRPVTYSSREHWGGKYNGEFISARELALCPEEALTRLFTTKDINYVQEKEFRLVEPRALQHENDQTGIEVPFPEYLKPIRAITGVEFYNNAQNLLDKFDLVIRSLDVEVTSFSQPRK
ncbi:hypothetical protein [Colwellia sp. E150_009]